MPTLVVTTPRPAGELFPETGGGDGSRLPAIRSDPSGTTDVGNGDRPPEEIETMTLTEDPATITEDMEVSMEIIPEIGCQEAPRHLISHSFNHSSWARLPQRLATKLDWRKSNYLRLAQGTIALLYVGEDDEGALDNVLRQIAPGLKDKIVAIDVLRDENDQDMLLDEPYYSLCTAAAEGKLAGIAGTPNCRTWSVLRLVKSNRGGLPCRGGLPRPLRLLRVLCPETAVRGGGDIDIRLPPHIIRIPLYNQQYFYKFLFLYLIKKFIL